MIFLYLDPGGGSLLIQLLIAGFLGFSFYIKRIFLYLKSIFFPPRKSKTSEIHTDEESTSDNL